MRYGVAFSAQLYNPYLSIRVMNVYISLSLLLHRVLMCPPLVIKHTVNYCES